MKRRKQATLTVKFDEDVYIDFLTSIDILRARSASNITHQFALGTIEEARKKTPPELWGDLRAERSKRFYEHSEAKSKEGRQRLEIGDSARTATKKKAV